MLQTRNGKRTGAAALRSATAMADEGAVTREEAILMVEARHLAQTLHPQFVAAGAPEYAAAVRGRGLPASPGAGVGRAVFTAAAAEAWHARGEAVVLVRAETSAEDVGGMWAAAAVVTARGGMTSHAAVVARGWGRPCVCGVAGLEVDAAGRAARLGGGFAIREGDWLSVNGASGEVLAGAQPTAPPEVAGELACFMAWVDAARALGVRANADSAADVAAAVRNGAEGVGLVRTEHQVRVGFHRRSRLRLERRSRLRFYRRSRLA
jgi:pyruvate,orthophosphate dikinase